MYLRYRKEVIQYDLMHYSYRGSKGKAKSKGGEDYNLLIVNVIKKPTE